MSDFQEDINDVLCDARDVRSALSLLQYHFQVSTSDFNSGKNFITDHPKDNDGSEITIGDCLDNIIETLEKWES